LVHDQGRFAFSIHTARSITEEAGREDICGNIARVDGDMNEQIFYDRRFDLGVVSKGVDLQRIWFGLGSNDLGKREHQYSSILAIS
jgi:hypothetical protein